MADLLELVHSDPEAALSASDRVIETVNDAETLSVAYQARAIVLRDAGKWSDALTSIRAALRHAARVDPDRSADVRATYGGTLFLAGRARDGLKQLDRAAAEASGATWATVLMRRAWVLMELGRWDAARADTVSALAGIRNQERPAWEARTLNNLGVIELTSGRARAADACFREAQQRFAEAGLIDEEVHARSNRGAVAYAVGDLPRALEIYGRIQPHEVANRWLRLGLVWDHYEAYLAAGLIPEAVALVEANLLAAGVPDWANADLNMALARVRLAAGDFEAAVRAAAEARHGYRRQDREWLETRAHLVEVRARLATGGRRGLGSQARELARQLHDSRADEAPVALILAGELASGLERRALWHSAAAYRTQPSALVRVSGWLGAALEGAEVGDRGRVLRCCARGFDALDDHRRTLGSAELRALATSHGRELAGLVLRHAVPAPRALLRWSERWRATALTEPPVRPSGPVSPELAALRDNGRRLAQARADGDPTEQLETERARLERAVRAEHHRRAGRRDESAARFDVGRFVTQVGTGTFVELVDVDGTLHVLVVQNGKVRRRVAGSVADALELAERGRSALRRAARGRPYDPGDLGQRLQDALLGTAADLLPDGPVTLSPTGRLHAAPWPLLPALTDRAFSLVPSAAQWSRARAVRPPRRRKVVLLAAPGLGSGGAEVPLLAERHPGAVLLEGEEAGVENAMAALDGATLAHVAAHGRFREDSPLFSSLEMADGPMSVYELERLRRAPYRLVLSACESGVLAPVGADELLGLASSLFSMGTAGLVCSIAEVNDDATAALMVDLHDHLTRNARGGLAGALLAARRAARGDPTREATAAAFLALGV